MCIRDRTSTGRPSLALRRAVARRLWPTAPQRSAACLGGLVQADALHGPLVGQAADTDFHWLLPVRWLHALRRLPGWACWPAASSRLLLPQVARGSRARCHGCCRWLVFCTQG
eukprot:784836-Alexandrium_andersonii.AAC.1